jgi:hypothetical protein
LGSWQRGHGDTFGTATLRIHWARRDELRPFDCLRF